ncbi:hypothetical protein LSH36_1929g00000 [Paralvinella palmiformis]|uniref:Uncharacterized protein n=1 Tax=Paralvinella palmiformis TaxID=53620 RepID=A0AAD9ISH2_9ANNE|nr:hypothetical protein LSH36_1929g00000 [Paralvinella palmiformis]
MGAIMCTGRWWCDLVVWSLEATKLSPFTEMTVHQ